MQSTNLGMAQATRSRELPAIIDRLAKIAESLDASASSLANNIERIAGPVPSPVPPGASNPNPSNTIAHFVTLCDRLENLSANIGQSATRLDALA